MSSPSATVAIHEAAADAMREDSYTFHISVLHTDTAHQGSDLAGCRPGRTKCCLSACSEKAGSTNQCHELYILQYQYMQQLGIFQ